MAEEAEIKEDLIDRAVKMKKGPPSYTVIEWNRQTREIFDKGKKPKQGRRYVFRCTRFDGKHAYFTLEGM